MGCVPTQPPTHRYLVTAQTTCPNGSKHAEPEAMGVADTAATSELALSVRSAWEKNVKSSGCPDHVGHAFDSGPFGHSGT